MARSTAAFLAYLVPGIGGILASAALVATTCLLLSPSISLSDAEPPDSNTIQRIEIDSHWAGLARPPFRSSKISIVHRGSDYYYESGTKINSDAVRALANAMDRPTLSKITPEALRITQTWLDNHAHAALAILTKNDDRAKNPDSQQEQLFLSTFSSLDAVGKVIESSYSPDQLGWTDDYPSINVTVFLSNGQRTTIRSTAQQALMLPWLIMTSSAVRKTYDPILTKAIARLLPKGTVNAERLSSDALFEEIATNVFDTIWDQWQALEADRVLGASLVPIRQRYRLQHSTIGLTWVDNDTEDFSRRWWDAKLSRPGLPTNVQIDLALEVVNGKLNSVQPFLDKGESFVNLVLSIPWVSRYIGSHKTCHMEVRFIDAGSLSDIARSEVDAELRAHGRYKLAADVDHYAASIALVSFDDGTGFDTPWSVWLALPDKRMILWYFHGSKILSYQASEFELWPAMDKFRGRWITSDLGIRDHAGAEIAADGHIAQR